MDILIGHPIVWSDGDFACVCDVRGDLSAWGSVALVKPGALEHRPDWRVFALVGSALPKLLFWSAVYPFLIGPSRGFIGFAALA